MTARITGFVSRSDAGLKPPKSYSSRVWPERGGVAIHYGGPPISAAKPDSDHSLCVRTWKFWQHFHQVTRGWADIAYTGGVCQHGYAFAGRGYGVRTAGQGTTDGNNRFLAFVFIGGGNQKPTKKALDAFDWWITQARKKGAGDEVRPHRSFKSTSCPGDFLADWTTLRHEKMIPLDKDEPRPPPKDDGIPYSSEVKKFQRLFEVKADGKWGPNTDKVGSRMQAAARTRAGYPKGLSFPHSVKFTQAVIDTKVDGKWGQNSQRALVAWVKRIQKLLGVKVDGSWGPKTNRAYNNKRTKLLWNYKKKPTKKEDLAKLQTLLETKSSNKWDKPTNWRMNTMRAAAITHVGYPRGRKWKFNVRLAQDIVDTKVDGKWGQNSQRALVAWVKEFQEALGVKADGSWGPKTDGAFKKVRYKFK